MVIIEFFVLSKMFNGTCAVLIFFISIFILWRIVWKSKNIFEDKEILDLDANENIILTQKDFEEWKNYYKHPLVISRLSHASE